MVFDGREWARQQMEDIRISVRELAENRPNPLTIQSIFPYQDDPSVVYTKLKQRDAERVGIRYVTQPLSLKDDVSVWLEAVQAANKNPRVDGILVQKPSTQAYQQVTGKSKQQFHSWWSAVAESIAPAKDVDGLSPLTMMDLAIRADRVQRGKEPPLDLLEELILPATAQAVIDIALHAVGSPEELRTHRVAIMGRSVIVGRPAFYGLRCLGVEADLLGSQDDLSVALKNSTVLIAATGQTDMVPPEWINTGAVLIDVGAPKPEFQAATQEKSSFFTPVPGGVGPVTRSSLLMNAVKLVR